jgi:NAD(P)-dependent dehydrogenase (short-subunit alcohol dehydrogenase family)
MSVSRHDRPALLLVGASRGLGHALAAEFIGRGWDVVGTVRGSARTPLHELAEAHRAKLSIEHLDITDTAGITALRHRLQGRTFDMLFVNAGTTNEHPEETIGQVDTDEFIRVMVTNALSPMRVIEGLDDLVRADGLIGVMSSGQGSIGDNTRGGREVYRGSKAALNQYMRSYAARQADSPKAMVLMAPGWIQTGLGGPDAPFTLEETVPAIVDVLLAKQGRPGLEYLDRFGKVVAW